MKIFISWSGKLSQELGNALKEWIPDVLQAVQCYFTPEDIQKGDRWSSEIAKELEESMFGIFCVTSENLNSGWMHFEAGAISKSKDDAQVCPILFGLRPTDLTGPLQQFQATVFSEEDMLKLMRAINAKLGDQALADARLERQFSRWWPELEKQINSILEQQIAPSEKPARSNRELLEEILTIVRESQKNNQQVKNDNNKFQFSEQTSRVFQKLSKQYIKTVDDFVKNNTDYELTMRNLKWMIPLFLDIIPFLKLPRQEKVDLVEATQQILLYEIPRFDTPF